MDPLARVRPGLRYLLAEICGVDRFQMRHWEREIARTNRKCKRPSQQELFWSRVAIASDDDCWLWTGTMMPTGYGIVGGQYTHRLAYLWTYGSLDLPCVCHHCDNPPCVNPMHLFEGTHRDNIHDSIQKGRWMESHRGAGIGVKKSHCKWGHSLVSANRTKVGHCRECERRRAREYHERKRRAG